MRDPRDVLGGRPRRRRPWPDAVGTLLRLTEPGPPVAGWAHGVAARAFGEILESGRGDLLGADPVQGAGPRASRPSGTAMTPASRPPSRPCSAGGRIRGGAASPGRDPRGVPRRPPRVGGRADRPGLLAPPGVARGPGPGGDAWFRQALPLLEKAPDGAGVIEGDYYGDPVSRTACALLVLCEGSRTSPTHGRPGGRPARPGRRADARVRQVLGAPPLAAGDRGRGSGAGIRGGGRNGPEPTASGSVGPSSRRFLQCARWVRRRPTPAARAVRAFADAR